MILRHHRIGAREMAWRLGIFAALSEGFQSLLPRTHIRAHSLLSSQPKRLVLTGSSTHVSHMQTHIPTHLFLKHLIN